MKNVRGACAVLALLCVVPHSSATDLPIADLNERVRSLAKPGLADNIEQDYSEITKYQTKEELKQYLAKVLSFRVEKLFHETVTAYEQVVRFSADHMELITKVQRTDGSEDILPPARLSLAKTHFFLGTSHFHYPHRSIRDFIEKELKFFRGDPEERLGVRIGDYNGDVLMQVGRPNDNVEYWISYFNEDILYEVPFYNDPARRRIRLGVFPIDEHSGLVTAMVNALLLERLRCVVWAEGEDFNDSDLNDCIVP